MVNVLLHNAKCKMQNANGFCFQTMSRQSRNVDLAKTNSGIHCLAESNSEVSSYLCQTYPNSQMADRSLSFESNTINSLLILEN